MAFATAASAERSSDSVGPSTTVERLSFAAATWFSALRSVASAGGEVGGIRVAQQTGQGCLGLVERDLCGFDLTGRLGVVERREDVACVDDVTDGDVDGGDDAGGAEGEIGGLGGGGDAGEGGGAGDRAGGGLDGLGLDGSDGVASGGEEVGGERGDDQERDAADPGEEAAPVVVAAEQGVEIGRRRIVCRHRACLSWLAGCAVVRPR